MTQSPGSLPLQSNTVRLAVVGMGLVVLTALGPWLHFHFGAYAFWAIVVATAATAAWAAASAGDIDPRIALWVILAVAAAMRAEMLFTEPYLSSDLYRYIWDGRVQAHGINPYRYLPAAPELAGLRDSDIFPKINRADYAPTIYPPAAQLVFLVISRIGETVMIMKLGMLGFEALGIGCLIVVLQRLGLPTRRIAAYAWHPMPIWEIAGNAHLDAAMLGLLLLSLWLFIDRRWLIAAAVATVAALIKPTALLALPVFWKPWDIRMPLVVLGLVVLFYAPYLGVGWNVLGFVPGYIAEEGYAAGGGFWYPDLLQFFTGKIAGIGKIYVFAAALAIGTLALSVGFRRDRSPAESVRALTLLLTLFLVLLTPHYSWYYLVAVPFLAVYPRSATLWVLTVGSLQIHDVVPGDQIPSSYHRQLVFHSVVLAAVLWDLRAATFESAKITMGVRQS